MSDTPTPRTEVVTLLLSKAIAVATNGSTVLSHEAYRGVCDYILDKERENAELLVRAEAAMRWKTALRNMLDTSVVVASTDDDVTICVTAEAYENAMKD